MSAASRLIRVAAAFLVAVAIGLTLWWTTGGAEVPNATAERTTPDSTAAPVDPSESPPPTAAPTPVPTAMPVPTPTPVPTPVTFEQSVPLGALDGVIGTPLPGCTLMRDDTIVAGSVTLACIEELAEVPVVAVAPGRVVHVVHELAATVGTDDAPPASTTPGPAGSAVAADSDDGGDNGDGPAIVVELVDPTDLGPPDTPGEWSWSSQRLLGPHVVIDHGPIGGTRNTQTLYGRLNSIEPDIAVGAEIAAGTPIGSVAGPSPSMLFSVWSNDVRQDGARAVNGAPDAAAQRLAARTLGDLIVSPTDPRCPLVLGSSQLPGASRGYRNGTHRGIDFGCGDALRSARAIADGTVVYLVDDYVDPSVAEREALLASAGIAGFTPQWTLVMLYGNVVVIDHGVIPGVGRMVTISAHLERIDPRLTLGSRVAQGQVIGEIGNRGTNASAQGIRGAGDPSLHLHWELFIDNWYLGDGLSSDEIREVVTLALCGAARTPGCPGS